MSTLIGHWALNISFAIYLVLYVPQVLFNRRRHSTRGLSFLMHALLVLAYLADLMYGFGRHMPLQYRLVDVIGLCCLCVQHIQFGYYEGLTRSYLAITSVLLLLAGFAIYSIWHALPAHVYVHAGVVAWAVGVFYTLPQIWHNHRFANAMGVSMVFIVFDILSSACDSIAAWTLHWDYPSRIGSPMELVLGMVLLAQALAYYRRVRSAGGFSYPPVSS